MKEVLQPEEPKPSRAEQVMKALAAAYPWCVERAEFRANEEGEGDWTVLLRGKWYSYAGKRMLPEELLDKASEYSPSFLIYNYSRELRPWAEPPAEKVDRYRNKKNDKQDTPELPLKRFSIHEIIWRASELDEVSPLIKTVDFLGFKLSIHADIVEILSRVEEQITSAAKTDPELHVSLDDIGEIHGWNWRTIAGSQSRSNHAYGIAIDILPKSLDGKATYWQWTENWWTVPYEGRYHPHEKVIRAFEEHGFTWGGKWMNFDTMHFEYRPEIILINDIEPEEVR